jgi:hypothetical protein
MDFTNEENDRRTKTRFAIQRDLRYKIAGEGVVVIAGSGETINIGSGGVAFRAEQTLSPGGFVELSISWPVLLDETCPMRLVVFGRVVRCTGSTVACTIDKYEFRTQSRALAPVIARSDSMLHRWVDEIRSKETARSSVA